MQMTMTAHPVQQLKQQVRGTVLTPDHAGYDQIRRGWNLSVDQYPALILVATSAGDVAAGVRFAREEGYGVAVQSTGHGVLHAADDSLLIITSLMDKVEIDPELQTARVGAGVMWKQVLEAGKAYGLAPLLGSTPYVGVVGYTLGGGMGWLARKYGYAADSVRWIEIVTPDGELRRASKDENSELFWALRGGGGNFGVVTAMEFDLYPVATIYGGEVMYPIEKLHDALHFFRDWTAHMPDEMTSSITIMNFPPIPAFPEHLRGKKFVQIKAAYVGAPEQGEALVQEWLDWATPIQNTFHVMPFNEIGTISNDPVDPTAGYATNELFNDLSDAAIDVLVEYVSAEQSPLLITTLRHMGGAMATADRSANAIGNRDALLVMEIVGITATPEMAAAVNRYIGQFRDALTPHLSGGMYLNFMGANEVNGRTKDAYTQENYRRLLAVKAQYDPNDLFHFSFNIPVGDTMGEAVHA